ncbi:MAG: T9SS type A sorting domain-containing protein [Bacteroidetes bacterium]|nr:T9SS type A sorting domain-containing protein [Bacteroidota bacterium]
MVNFTKFISTLGLSAILLSTAGFAQQPLTPEAQKKVNQLKLSGQLTGHEQLINQHPSNARITPPTPNQAGELCNCWIDRDTSWTIVPFDCQGVSGGPGVAPEYRNDDWSACIGLPFSFCFYGQPIDSVYINNNGNISIGASYSTYSPISFPTTSFSMIAPLWSDVDTRGPNSGLEYYKMTNTHLIVQWDGVDYFNSDTSFGGSTHQSLFNTYQLIITNGTDPILPTGQNVSFCYKDMQWTTGDASLGTNGFGGYPATCGVNQGNGVDYFQIGLYDTSLTIWDGPYGLNDGIYSLSNQSFNFNVCDSTNTPPIAVANYVCDTLVLCIGDTGYISAGYLSPEPNQVTSIAMDTIGLHGVSILNDSIANLAGTNIQIIGQPGNEGYHLLHLYATDNGTPQQTTTTYIVVSILNCSVGISDPGASGILQISPNPVSDFVTVNYSSARMAASSLEIRNALGQTVRTITIDPSLLFNKTVSVTDLPAGIYFVHLSTSKGMLEQKFIKQ